MKGEDSAAARVLIADDHALLRAGLRTMLAREPDLEIVGEAENGREAVELCRELRPDLVLMDVGMPEMDGLEATRIVKAESPTTSVLIVSAHPDPEYLIDGVKAGAAGYLLKATPPEQVIGSIRRVLRGEFPLDGELAMKVIRRLASEEKPRKAPSPDGNRGTDLPFSLTPRELGVLTLLTQGKTNRQISEELHLSLSTVKRHLERIILEARRLRPHPGGCKGRRARPHRTRENETGSLKVSRLTDVRLPPCRHTGRYRDVGG